MNHFTLKDPNHDHEHFTKRIVIAALLVALLLLVLIVRLWFLQINDFTKYQTLSDNNSVNLLPIAPQRGLIYDRNHVLLAENIPAFHLEITPEQVTDMNATLNMLSDVIALTPEEITHFNTQLNHNRRFEGVPIRYQLTEEDLANIAVNQHRLPGVSVVAGLIRHYPYPESLVHTLGYISQINAQELRTLDASNYSATQSIGKVGLEQQYEDILHGQVGHQQVETNASGRVVRTLNRTPSIPGNNLILTLDQALTEVAYQALGDKRGAVVAIEPATGAILAMSSTPSYNPNHFVVGLDRQTYQTLATSSDQPLYNRAISGQYPPGSTIKPALGLMGLQTQTITAEEKKFDPGWFQLPGDSHRYRDWKRTGHGWLNLIEAITQSCSTFFYQLAHNLGIEAMSQVLSEFGFGQKTGIDLPGERSGLVPTRAWKQVERHEPWYPGETLITGIGQGFTLVTPIQLAQYIATLANQGQVVQPYLVETMIDANSISTSIAPSMLEKVVFNDEDWHHIHQAMVDVVNTPYGTAFNVFRDAPYTAAGKTGTAQVSSIGQDEEYDAESLSENLRDHHLFVGYAPATNPQIAIAVVTENNTGASEIARIILDHYLDEDIS